MKRTLQAAAVAFAVGGTALVSPASAFAAMPAKYKNCTNLNRSYAHGVGRSNAHDKVASGSKPVTNWTRNTTEYNRAVHYNAGLDRDHDGIACEKH